MRPRRKLIDRLRAQAGRPVVSTLTATAVIQLLNVVTGVLLARALAPSGRGELAAVLLWPMLLLYVGTVGITDSITYYTARRVAPLRVIVGTSLGLALVQVTVLVGLGLILIPLVLDHYGSEVVRAGLLFLTVIPIGLPSMYLIFLLNGMRSFLPFNVLRVTVIAVPAAGLIALYAFGALTVTTAVIAYLGGQLLTLAAAIIVALPSSGIARPSRAVGRRMISYGWKSWLSTTSNLLNERVDQLVISIFLSSASLGLYVVAWTMTSLTTLIGASVIYAALPAIASSASVEIRRAAAAEYIGLTLAGAVLVSVPLFVLAPELLGLAFGPAFREATDQARVLLAASVVLAVGRVLGAVLKGANRPLDAGLAEVVGLVFTCVGLAALLPLLGTMGAAITSAVAYSATAIFALRRANQALGARGLELLRPPLPHQLAKIRARSSTASS